MSILQRSGAKKLSNSDYYHTKLHVVILATFSEPGLKFDEELIANQNGLEGQKLILGW